MNTYVSGVVAGLTATLVLSVLMMLKGMMGMMPDLNVIEMLAGMMGAGLAVGWIAHFAIGAGYGLLFARLFGTAHTDKGVGRGIAIGVGGWLVMMVLLMPMAGGGLFGLTMPSGMMVPVATLLLHVIFGAVLGASYAGLRKGQAARQG